MSLNPQTHRLLNQALAKRVLLKKHTNAVRLIDGIGDGLDGLVVEQHNRHVVAQVFNPFWLKEMNHLKSFLTETIGIDYLIVKDRTQSASSKVDAIPFHVLIQTKDSRTIVEENNLKFEVDLNDTLNTGLFLDMRANRYRIGQACAKKKVLNCFAYTCSFGVYARANGAREVINVDVSKKILERGRQNYELNKIEPEANGFIKADAVIYLEKAEKKNNFFDVIILDPPSFARAENKVFSVEKDLPYLMTLALNVLNPKGSIFVSTNFSGISCDKLEQLFRKQAEGRSFRKITLLGQDEDFTGSGQVKESHLAAIWVEG